MLREAARAPVGAGASLLLLVFALAACCPTPAYVESQSSARPSSGEADTAKAIERYADRLLAQARATEPKTTKLLVDLATRHGGEMVKLEHRLKTRESMLRKIRARLTEDPKATVGDIVIDDALRYTMRVDDEPPGHYLEAAKTTLAELEQRGHQVRTIKNYWPSDDNYSGLNCSLVAPEGVAWELQFHTSASFEVQSRTRDAYEELREVTTPVERKRELFDQMTRAWQAVPVPRDILQPGALHPGVEIRRRPRP